MLSRGLDDKNDFRPKPITPLINKLCAQPHDNHERKEPYLQEIYNNEETKNIFKMLDHPFLYVWITPHSIIDKINFKFKFNLFINDLTGINDDYNNMYSNKNGQSVYKYVFETTYKQIEAIYVIATSSRKHFPVQKFPICMYIFLHISIHHHMYRIIHCIQCYQRHWHNEVIN